MPVSNTGSLNTARQSRFQGIVLAGVFLCILVCLSFAWAKDERAPKPGANSIRSNNDLALYQHISHLSSGGMTANVRNGGTSSDQEGDNQGIPFDAANTVGNGNVGSCTNSSLCTSNGAGCTGLVGCTSSGCTSYGVEGTCTSQTNCTGGAAGSCTEAATCTSGVNGNTCTASNNSIAGCTSGNYCTQSSWCTNGTYCTSGVCTTTNCTSSAAANYCTVGSAGHCTPNELGKTSTLAGARVPGGTLPLHLIAFPLVAGLAAFGISRFTKS